MDKKTDRELREAQIKKRKEKYMSLSPIEKSEYSISVICRLNSHGFNINKELLDSYSINAFELACIWKDKGLRSLKARDVRYGKKYETWHHVEKYFNKSYLEHDFSLNVFYEATEIYSKHYPQD